MPRWTLNYCCFYQDENMWVMVMKEQQGWIKCPWNTPFMFVSFTCSPEKKSNQINKKIEKLFFFFLLLLLLLTFLLCLLVSYATRWREWGSDIAWGQAARRAQRWSWWWGWGAVGRPSFRRYYWGCVTSHNPWLHEDDKQRWEGRG